MFPDRACDPQWILVIKAGSREIATWLQPDANYFWRLIVTNWTNLACCRFGGSAVMIPTGSRLIGEYNSSVAQGASRVFIVWSRLIRPDGVTISLGSPAVDELGRGGLGGKVNRHFFQRFGNAILLSVISGGINAAAASVSRGSSVIVSTTTEATALATQALQGSDISPTIKTNQGALVRVFVARDLDFTAVRAVGQ
jgi:type IV secretory pathway VirB10-like protein